MRSKKISLEMLARDLWGSYLLHNLEESRALYLADFTRFHPILSELRVDGFYFPSFVSYWNEHMYSLPSTLTEATEYAIKHHVQLYCKEHQLEFGNVWDVVQDRLYEIGKQALNNQSKKPPHQSDDSSESGNAFLYDLLPDVNAYYILYFIEGSNELQHVLRQNIYFYALAVYLSKPRNTQIIRDKFDFFAKSAPTILHFVAGIIMEKLTFFNIFLDHITAKECPVNVGLLSLLGRCLIETKYPEKFIGYVQQRLKLQNLDLSTSNLDIISHYCLEGLELLLEQTSIIEKLDIVSQNEESNLSRSFCEDLKFKRDNPNCDIEFHITNLAELRIVARFLKFYELFIAHKQFSNRSQITLRCIAIKATENMLYNESHRTGEILVGALAVCQTLKSFHLSGFEKKFVNDFLKNIIKKNKPLTVTSIEFPNNQLDHSCIPVVMNAMDFIPFLEKLDVRNNNLGCKGSVALLPLVDKVNVLLENNGVNESVDRLFEDQALSEQIGDLKPYISEIKTIDDIRKLQGKSEHVTQLKIQKSLPAPIDNLFATLALFTHLEDVDFSECGITERSAKELADVFEYLPALEYVNLSSNNIGDKGVKYVAKNVHKLKNVKTVDFSKTNIGFRGMKDLHESIEKHDQEKINVAHNLTGLSYVLPYIKNRLTSFPSDFNLQACRVSLDKLWFIMDLNKVGKTLRVNEQWNRRTFDCFCKGLSDLYFVQYLDLSHGNIGDVGAESLCEAMESLLELEQLSLSHNNIGDDVVRIICSGAPKLLNLNHLDLSHNNIQAQGAESVGRGTENLNWFRHLNLSHNKIGSSGVEALGRSLNNLFHLDLCDNNIGADGVKELCMGKEKFANLTHVDLSYNDIGDVGAEYLVRESEKFTDLKHLRLSHNNISDVGAESLGKGIEIKSNLRHFDISHNNIEEDGAKKLMVGIEKLERLKRLDLSYNDLKVNGSKSVMVAFKKKNRLRHLDLSCNDIGDDGAGIVSEGIEELQWLRHLALSHNKIGNVGADKVSRAVVKLTQFEHLDLSHNRIGDTTAKELCDVIKCMANVMKKGGSSKSDRVKKLDLSHNLITDSGADLLQSTIETLDIAPSVDLQHNKMHDGEKYFKTKSPCPSISDKPPAASVLVTPSRLKHWQKGFSLRETSLSDLGSSSSAYHSDMVSGDQVSHSDLVSASGDSDYSGSQASMSVYKDLTEESETYQIDNTFPDYDSSDSSV